MARSLNNGSRKRRRASTTINPPPTSDSDDTVGMERPVPTVPTVPSGTKFIVGLDYGTTYTSVSYIKFDAANPPKTIFADQIKSVDRWPDCGAFWRSPEVSSESWYHGNKFYWGYAARQAIEALKNGNLNYRNRIIQHAKLLLNERPEDIQAPRRELGGTMNRLEKNGKYVIKDYLREVLKYTKAHLEKKDKFTEDCEVELTFCVPAGWPARALRTMQEILLEVAQEIKFGILAPLFILNEPEAAAAYMLEAIPGCNKLKAGDVFIVCDAGGGTVDAITYRVCREHPFRLDEVVSPGGRNCGSSYINQAFKAEAIKRLEDTNHASLQGPSFEYIIEYNVMDKFEKIKREFRPEDGLEGDASIVVPGLKEDPTKGFGNSLLHIPRKQIRGFFDWSLDGTGELIREQMSAADKIGLTVSNILLVGGLSTSPFLEDYIRNTFSGLNILKNEEGDMAVAVSHGAVFRALNKEYGPRRQLQSNFGFLQIVEYNRKLRAHRAGFRTRNGINGKEYMYDVIDWVIKKKQKRALSNKAPFVTRNYQTFGIDEEPVIRQRIYVSDDDRVYDGYQMDHGHNRGAEPYGRLVVDLQKVKDEGLFQTIPGPQGDFYQIYYDLIMEVDGRTLTVKLLCPPGGQCRGETQLCIAAAFIPGTE
ncbi:hypothetical protein UA08_00508 [Talaromyces atroroseus]|uniref:Heat shock 70 kDa protein 12A n=1 Tax=Talaromyces atroroseus TaxID=1441469 RepID=A0A225B649_TALAT|nr:hypothetical protein UA08_00508 [Talaromyces atroroseus]OKL63609.1 hypothetical protein UA08_00508 [Talaromyces atroroseus]